MVRTAPQLGIALVELLVSMVLTAVIAGAMLALLDPSRGTFQTEPERADMQQRLRVAVDSLGSELQSAGGGAFQGRDNGPLVYWFAPVLPFREGRSADPAGTFRTSTITVLYVASSASQTTIQMPAAARSGPIQVNQEPGCPDSVCGFQPGQIALLYDDTGSFDLFSVTSVSPPAIALRHEMTDSSKTYAPGARIVRAVARTFLLKADTGTGALQLARYDGGASADAPAVDHVVSLSFDYFGEPAPPSMIRPLSAPAGPWTTYGPKPPALGVQTTAYPPGENCVFARDEELNPTPRLPALGAGGPALTMLTAPQLTDGPWCPDALNVNRYDADLLRIRKITVTVRAESAIKALRGPSSVLFANAGGSRSGYRFAPDQEIRFDVVPPNLSVSR